MAYNAAVRSHTPVGPLPKLLTPPEVARALGCSEWWVKEQARRRRIPFTRVGGAYRFTAEHYHEIVRIFEERPDCRTPNVDTTPPRRQVNAPAMGSAVVQLKARPPRRRRNIQ